MSTDHAQAGMRVRLVGLLVAEVALVLGLHLLARLDAFAIDWSDLSGWVDDTAFEDAFGTALLFVALVLAYWLLLSTVSYLAASLSGRPAAIGALQWLTLPPVRRLVRRAVALSIAASAVTGPLWPAVSTLSGDGGSQRPIVKASHQAEMLVAAGDPVEQLGWTGWAGLLRERLAAEPTDVEGDWSPDLILPSHLPAAPPVADAGRSPVEPSDLQGNESPVVMVPPHLQEPPPGEAGDAAESPAANVAPGPGATASHTVRVARGDHLWGLSEQHLHRVLGRSALEDHEIATYWVRVIDANRATIRSGDPDLIYPGEIIQLPPVRL